MSAESYKTRYFNKIQYDEVLGALCKTSTKIEKIKAEYEYYYALPDDIREFFVMPYNYIENDGSASYYIEKLDIEDAAKQYVSNTKSRDWYDKLMEHVDRFLSVAPIQELTAKSMVEEAYDLVVRKSAMRVGLLEQEQGWLSSPYRAELEALGITPKSLVARLEKAFNFFIKDRSTHRKTLSHGDLCFSNILWSEEQDIFRLIDPKGIESLYLDEYYDIAKLCHSITGNYDDIVYENYELDYENKTVKITRQEDEYYWDTFRQWTIDRGFSFELVRVYETSIFISMLVNHLDDDKRVAAFMLNASRHLETLSCGIESVDED
jgi:hypothetical protein